MPMPQDNCCSSHEHRGIGEDCGTSFDPSYLAAKKSIDDRSLNNHVCKTLCHLLPQTGGNEPLRILELGAGIGTMLERLVDWGVLTGSIAYLAADMDLGQIRAARKYLSQWSKNRGYSLSWRQRNGRLRTAGAEISLQLELARVEELAERSASLGPFHLVLAHALLDLVDFTAVLEPLLSRLTRDGLAYFTCNFDGETIFLPECEVDEKIIRAYHGSMETRLCGASRTGRRLLMFLQNIGLEIKAAGSSDWVIHPRGDKYTRDEAFFLHAIVQTVADELAGQNLFPADGDNLTGWTRLRHQQIDAGELSFIARHLDLLAQRRSLQHNKTNNPVGLNNEESRP